MGVKFDPFIAQKVALWEEAKGKLRAMIAVDGCKTEETRDPFKVREGGSKYSYEVIQTIVEDFIKEIEDNEHHM